MRRLALLLVIIASACSGKSQAPEPRPADPPRKLETGLTALPPETPGWWELPKAPPTQTTAAPVAYAANPKPHLVLFTASWCSPCSAGVIIDRRLIDDVQGKLPVGIGLLEPDADFQKSVLAHWFHDLPIYSEAGSRELGRRCGIESLPGACLLEGDKVLWHGETGNARRAMRAYVAGKLADDQAATSLALEQLKALSTAEATDDQVKQVVERMAGLTGSASAAVWELVNGTALSPTACKLSIPLARQIVEETHGVSFAATDILATALWKCDHKDEAKKYAQRTLDACAAVQGLCGQETGHAKQYLGD